jgi:hypothetical protein
MVIGIMVLIGIAMFLYFLGGQVYNKSRVELDLKYPRLVAILLSSDDRIRVIKKSSNVLVIGVVSMGGKTLFTIKERPKEDGGDEVLITYSIKDNPTTKDFDLRYVFSEQKCINDPEYVLTSINQSIKDYLVSNNFFNN